MEETGWNAEEMKKRFNELVWECCPGYWTATTMEATANELLKVWMAWMQRNAPAKPVE